MQTTVEYIRNTLRREISEQYDVGDLLPNERDLAQRFEVSRNTIRETMIHLEALSLIEKTKRGARVRRPDMGLIFQELTQFFDTSARSFSDVLNFRRINETGAAPLMVCHVTNEILHELQTSNRRITTALTSRDAAEADYDFHLSLVRASGNQILLQMYEMMAEPMIFYMEIGKSHQLETAGAAHQHEQIIKALKMRDVNALQDKLSDHFQHSGNVLAQWVSERMGPGEAISLWPSQGRSTPDD